MPRVLSGSFVTFQATASEQTLFSLLVEALNFIAPKVSRGKLDDIRDEILDAARWSKEAEDTRPKCEQISTKILTL